MTTLLADPLPADPLPADPLARSLALANAVTADESWWEDRPVLRHAARPLVTAAGEQAFAGRAIDAALQRRIMVAELAMAANTATLLQRQRDAVGAGS